ncbi:MAG: C39 family peptidase, partial [Candidatus Rokuibacteriota bacterium]
RASWLVALSASDGAGPAHDGGGRATRLAVPALTQMTEPEAVRLRICSPASVAMVLRYWGHAPSVAAVAAAVFHPAHDLYGVWPAAIRVAARYGIAGYLLRFPDWGAAVWCLAQGMPLIASIRYAEGEVEGAPIGRTDGHLVVVTGCDGETVLVNDPAALTVREVPRRYRLEQFRRAWLDRGGVGYVLFKPALDRSSIKQDPSGRSPRRRGTRPRGC